MLNLRESLWRAPSLSPTSNPEAGWWLRSSLAQVLRFFEQMRLVVLLIAADPVVADEPCLAREEGSWIRLPGQSSFRVCVAEEVNVIPQHFLHLGDLCRGVHARRSVEGVMHACSSLGCECLSNRLCELSIAHL